MENSSPSTYGPPNWVTGVHSSSFKSPITSPQTNSFKESPDFSPYSYSSPIKYQSRGNRGGGRRYFNRSSGSYNSGNFGSPSNSHHYHRRNRSQGNHQRFSNDSSDNFNISQYAHPSMLEDPWEELERNLKEAEEISEKSSSPEDLDNETSVQN